jgi:integrase
LRYFGERHLRRPLGAQVPAASRVRQQAGAPALIPPDGMCGAMPHVRLQHCTPHRFRHTFGTMCSRPASTVRVIQRLLAHADLSTAMLYTKVADAQALAGVLRLPGIPGQAVPLTGPDSAPQGNHPLEAPRKCPE